MLCQSSAWLCAAAGIVALCSLHADLSGTPGFRWLFICYLRCCKEKPAMTSLACLLLQEPSEYGEVGVYIWDAHWVCQFKIHVWVFSYKRWSWVYLNCSWRHEKCRTDSLQSICYQRLLTVPHSCRNKSVHFSCSFGYLLLDFECICHLKYWRY